MILGYPPIEREWLCPACSADERRQSLRYALILVGVIALAIVTVLVAVYYVI